MAKRHYQTILQRLTTKGERKTSTRFIEESLSISRKGLSSLDLSGVETREEMKHNPININELIIYKDIVPKEIMVEVITPVEMKVGRNCSLLARGQAKLTPPEKEGLHPYGDLQCSLGCRCFFYLGNPTTPPLISVIETSIVRTFIQSAREEVEQRFMNAFTSLVLVRAPCTYLFLIGEERKEKVVVEAELRDLKVAYTSLKDNMQGIVIQLGSTEKELQMAYNKVAALKQGILKEKATQDSLRVELFIVKVKAQNSHARLKALRNSFEEFKDFFEGYATLTEIVRDKIFIAMSNMYFFNQSKGMQVDFSVVLHHVRMLDFTDVFPAMAVIAQHEEYLAEEPCLDIQALAPNSS
uniref:Uncharacterized protein n=1 Tax=Populus trichocarpa TaxID=3694 RepID=B9NF87_POPTR